jgi:hypothetical protein
MGRAHLAAAAKECVATVARFERRGLKRQVTRLDDVAVVAQAIE